jgi:HAD superfamily hydrolase (TIGR01490 family)
MNSDTKNNIVFIDIDGTLIKGQSQKYFISLLKDKGFLNLFDFIIIYIWFFLYKINLVNNSKWILNFSLRRFKGVDECRIENLMEELYETIFRNKLFKYAEDAIDVFKRNNFRVVLLSSAVEPVTKVFSEKLNIPDYICTEIEVDENNKYTGKIKGEHVYGKIKTQFAKEYISRNNLNNLKTYIVSDHYSDIDLFKGFDLPIIANPDPRMRIWGVQNKIPVIYFDKHESIQHLESYIKS